MNSTEMLENFEESLADYMLGKHLEEIGDRLNDLANKANSPAKRDAYHMAAAEVFVLALKQLACAKEKLLTEKDEAE